MENNNNPRIQCDNCGKWRRLYDRENNQLSFPFYPGEDDPAMDEIWFDSLCVWCHLLFGIVLPPFKEVSK